MGPVGNERRLEGRELEHEVETNLKEIGGDERSSFKGESPCYSAF